MTESILTSIKKLLGISEDYTEFDTDIIISINSVFSILSQLGVGPKKPFMITDKTAVWSDFMEDKDNIEMVKSFMHLKVKMIFDPPTTSSTNTAYTELLKELEWRLHSEENYHHG